MKDIGHPPNAIKTEAVEKSIAVLPFVNMSDDRLVYSHLITLPENLPDYPALQATLDKPELKALFEIRRINLLLKKDNTDV